MSAIAFTSFTLPNGQVLPNRLAKAAMEENLADHGHIPGEALFKLYETWAKGQSGLLITGNVMVDHRAMTGPGGVALEANTALEPFRRWAKAGKAGDTKLWMQINHPGRQVYAAMGGKVLSPSDVALDMGKYSKLFGQPKAMSESDIEDVIGRFVTTAQNAVEAGFDGVQIHAAHGYLVSQFLSPLTNKRSDQWGGPLDNRARLLLEIVRRVKAALPSSAAVSVKLNSADFQRGGFDENDALEVVKQLEALQVDLVELSGGSYESPAMQGRTADGRTLAREAYFLEFAERIAAQTSVPLMTTGGVTRLSVAERVLKAGVDIVGMGRALAFAPDLPKQWQNDAAQIAQIPTINWRDKTMSAMAVMALTKRQLRRMGVGKLPSTGLSPLVSLVADQWRLKRLTQAYRRRYRTASTRHSR